MNLHTSENFWPIKNGLKENYPSLQKTVKADVAIIGAGISGALMAQSLCKAGFDVVILDKRHASFGSTAASTALIQYEINISLRELIQKASFQFTSFKSHLKDHQNENELRKLYGISETHWMSQGDIKEKYGFKKLGGIFSKDGAVLDPFKLTHNILKSFTKKNLRVFDNTEVIDIQYKKNGVVLKCHTGFSVHAKKLVIAAGYESQKYLPKKVEIPNTTYAIVSEVIDQKDFWYKNSMIWETAVPYLYLRTTKDNRILIGGKDDPSHNPRRRDKNLPAKIKQLEKNFGKLFPDIPFKTDYSWAGIFCGTKDGLPYIGSIPERPHTYFSLGFGGNGITYSAIAAKIIPDLINNLENSNEKLFSFKR